MTNIRNLRSRDLHTVAETHTFQRHARAAGMSNEEIDNLVAFLAENPDAGDEIVGTGGCRKLRWARRGGGKRGGCRTVTFYSGATMPVFLLTVFAKGERADLTQGERNDLRKLTKVVATEYRERIRVR